jgi:hypothetical protein
MVHDQIMGVGGLAISVKTRTRSVNPAAVTEGVTRRRISKKAVLALNL